MEQNQQTIKSNLRWRKHTLRHRFKDSWIFVIYSTFCPLYSFWQRKKIRQQYEIGFFWIGKSWRRFGVSYCVPFLTKRNIFVCDCVWPNGKHMPTSARLFGFREWNFVDCIHFGSLCSYTFLLTFIVAIYGNSMECECWMEISKKREKKLNLSSHVNFSFNCRRSIAWIYDYDIFAPQQKRTKNWWRWFFFEIRYNFECNHYHNEFVGTYEYKIVADFANESSSFAQSEQTTHKLTS